MHRVCFVVEFFRCQRDRNKDKQPKQWVATDFLKEQLHGTMIQFPQTFAIMNTTKSNGLLRRTLLKKKIARCILTERLIEDVPSPTKMIHAHCGYGSSISLPLSNEPYSTE